MKYAPGTPVKVTIREQEVLAFAFYGIAEPRLRWYVPNPPWPIKTHDPEQDFDTWFLGAQGTDPRPLVVIDPEDMAEVERFREIASRWADRVPYSDAREEGDLTHGDAMQAALREYAAPAPPEPKGLGAVVESFEGSVWVRGHHNTKSPWVRTAFGDHRDWDSIPTPLTVLHEGYTPEAES